MLQEANCFLAFSWWTGLVFFNERGIKRWTKNCRERKVQWRSLWRRAGCLGDKSVWTSHSVLSGVWIKERWEVMVEEVFCLGQQHWGWSGDSSPKSSSQHCVGFYIFLLNKYELVIFPLLLLFKQLSATISLYILYLQMFVKFAVLSSIFIYF